MKYLKTFENYSINESNNEIKNRFSELVNDKYDELGIDLKIDSTVVLGEIADQLKGEFPNIFKFECDYQRTSSSSYSYGSGSGPSEEHFQVSLKVFNTEKDFEDQDPSEYFTEKVGIPSDEDYW